MSPAAVARRTLTNRRLGNVEKVRRLLLLVLFVELETLAILGWTVGCPAPAWWLLAATGAAYLAVDAPWWIRDLSGHRTPETGGWG